MKQKNVYICNDCGYQSAKWMGKCPSCGTWGSLEETIVREEKAKPAARAAVSASSTGRAPRRISEIKSDEEVRTVTGIGELDRVLGGGIVLRLARACRRRPGHRKINAAFADMSSARQFKKNPLHIRRGIRAPNQAARRAARRNCRRAVSYQ